MAFEFFTAECLARVTRHRSLGPPLASSPTHYVLVELENADGAELEAFVESLFANDLVSDGTMAQGSSQAAQLWALREGISESLSATVCRIKTTFRCRSPGSKRFAPSSSTCSMSGIPAGRSASSVTSATATSTST